MTSQSLQFDEYYAWRSKPLDSVANSRLDYLDDESIRWPSHELQRLKNERVIDNAILSSFEDSIKSVLSKRSPLPKLEATSSGVIAIWELRGVRLCIKCKSPRVFEGEFANKRINHHWSNVFSDNWKAIDSAVRLLTILFNSKWPWMEDSIQLYTLRRYEESLDVIFGNVDDLLLAGRFGEVDEILEGLAEGRFSNSQLLTLLTATLPARSRLSKYGHTLARVRRLFGLRNVDAANLLAGLD